MFDLLVVGLRWPPETFIVRLLNGLLAGGVRVTVATADRPYGAWCDHPGFSWIHAPSWEAGRMTRLRRLVGMGLAAGLRARGDIGWIADHAARAEDHVERLHIWYRNLPFAGRSWDLVYFPWNGGGVTYAPLLERGWPSVISCRGSQINVDPHDPRRAGLAENLGRTFERATAVHCVSEAIRDEAAHLGLDPAKASVIRPAIDPDFFRPGAPTDRGDGIFRVVSTGSLIWKKGLEYALSAVRRLVDRHVPVSFTIIGDGPERQRVVYTLRDLRLDGRVHLLGRVAPTEVRDVLQRSDAFVLASVTEGISNAVLEAMGCGLPVVTTDCGGMREAITDGEEGFVVPVRDAEALADALAVLFEDAERRHAMGRAGRARVLRAHTLDGQVAAFISLFEDVQRS